jgi:hypothetical protein
MATSLLSGRALSTDARPAITGLHVLVVVGLALAAVVWGATFIIGTETHEFEMYLALLAFYGVCSAAFVMSRIRRGKLHLFEMPVFLAVTSFFQFGLIPLRNFIDPTQLDVNLSANGEELVRALSYIILGMMAFWIGCELFRLKEGGRMSTGQRAQSAASESHKGRVLLAFGLLYAVGFATRFYLLRNNLYSYLASMDEYYENLALMQVLNYVSQFGTLALIVATIESYRNRHDPLWRTLFVVVLLSEVLWGLISGMKGLVLQNFFVVAIVSSFVMKRLSLRWLVFLFFALVLFYPVSDVYRSIVRGRDAREVTSFQGAVSTGYMALSKVEEGASSSGDVWREGLDRTLQRLDLLTSVAQVLTLGPRADMLRGDECWWMLPIYPFIPRFLWPSKPILQEGGRFTLALRGGSGDAATAGSSTAVAYPGDLYLQFGLLGIPIGMFVLGIVAQWLTNRMSDPVEPRELFVYVPIFLIGFGFGGDAFDLWATLMKFLAILYGLRWIIYGRGVGHRRLVPSRPSGLGRS